MRWSGGRACSPRSSARRAGIRSGMRQRLGIAAAMLGDPPILMMDEPFNGMDPEGIVWMRGFLRSLAAEGRAVLVSSHLMSELQDTADHLVVVGRGKVIADTSVADSDLRRVRRPGHGAHHRAHRGDDRADPCGSNRGSHRAGHADGLRADLTARGHAAGRRRGAVLRGVRAPRDAGGGVHGADQGRGRVPRRGGQYGRRRDDRRHRHPVPLGPAGRARWLRPATARRVDQVPERARLDHRHGGRRAADARGRPARGPGQHRVHQWPERAGKARCGLRHAGSDRPGR